MESLEIEGKSIEEAIQAACNQLNVPKEQLDIQVLNSGSTGIFGLVGSKKAKIRATVKEAVPEPERLPESIPTISSESDSSAIPLPETDMIAEARSVTSAILNFMGLEAELEVEKERETLHIKIKGDEAGGILIGRRGETLDAFQYLITRILNRKTPEKIKVVLDSGDYRSRRKNYLETLALNMAEKSKQTGKPVVISPLNAHDRRIIHLILEKDKDLKTISRGEGHLKKIVVSAVKRDRTIEAPSDPGAKGED
jgi:spoIIIJ-associated protein